MPDEFTQVLFDQYGGSMSEKSTSEELEQKVRKLEKENENLKKRYLALAEDSPIGILICDKKGQIEYINCRMLEILGSPGIEESKKINLLFFPPLNEAGFSQPLDKCLKTGKPQKIEVQYKSKWGKPIWALSHISPLIDKADIIGAQVMATDISDRKRIEKALKKSEARMKMLSDATFEAIFFSEKGICIDQNKTAEKIFGYTHKEAVGKQGTEWIVPEDRDLVINNMLSGYEKPYQVTALRKNGTTFPAEIQARMINFEGRKVRVTALRDITWNKRATKKLLFKENIIRSSSSPIVTCDLDGMMTFGNPAFMKIWGFGNPEEFLGRSIWKFWLVEDRLNDIMQALHNKDIWVGENQAKRKDGSLFDVQVSAAMVRDIEGNPVAITSTLIDITKQKKIQKALEKSRGKYKSLTNNLNIGIYRNTVGPKGKFIEANPAIIKMFGFNSREDFFNLNVSDLYLNQSDRAKFNLKMLKQGEVRNEELQLQKKDGTLFTASTTAVAVKNEKGEIKYFDGIVEDITERKKAKEKLQKNRDDFQNTLNSLKEFLVKIDKNFVVQFNNRASAELYNVDRNFAGRHCYEVFWNKNTICSGCIAKKAMDAKTQTEELRYHPSGKIFDRTVYPVFDENGEVNGATIQALDITKREKAQKGKIKAQKIALENEKYALVGQIAGKMAHDFNNILGIIMGNTELALLDCTDDQTRETFELIFNQTIRGKNLTKNLVAFAKDQEPKQEYFSINEKIDLVLNLLKKDMQNIEVIKEWSPGLPDLLADPGMVEHCFVNLLQNSVHAISKSHHPTIIIRTYSQNKYICIELEDNGCGIPEKCIKRIFEPAFTLKGSWDVTGSYGSGIKGTGYGMANVKKYINQHNGFIEIDSKVGKGTMITICFPEINKVLSEEEIEAIKKTDFHFEKNILLVEDEQAISSVQYRILTHEPCNHKVDVAANGQMAVDLFDRNDYDFASLDYVLPGEINGMDVYNHIRKTNKILPILFVSGNLEFLQSIKELKKQDPYVDHISKPCQNKDYINNINRLLDFKKILQGISD